MNGLKSEQKNVEIEAKFNREPVNLLEDRGNVVEGWSSSRWLKV